MTALIWAAAGTVYGLAALIAARLIAGHLAYLWWDSAGQKPWDRYHSTPRPSGGQWLCAAFVGMVVAVLWPAVLMLTVAPLPKVGAERAEDLRQREQRIKRAEKELGIE